MTWHQKRAARLTRRAGTWIGALRGDPHRKTRAALGDLNDHFLRDLGIWRERSAGPRRYDPWM